MASAPGQRPGWIGVDLDGTLAQWPTPGIATVRDGIGPAIPRMVARVKDLLADGWWVKIFTARVATTEPHELELHRLLIDGFCLKEFGQTFEITNAKDLDCIRIYDDIAVSIVRNTGRAPWEES